MERFFIDTSAWYAFLVKNEKDHQHIVNLLTQPNQHLITSNNVFSELYTLLMARGYEEVAHSFGEKLREGKVGVIYRISEEDEEKAWGILKIKRGRGLSYVDATTTAMMERMQIKKIITLDSDFREFGFEIYPDDIE